MREKEEREGKERKRWASNLERYNEYEMLGECYGGCVVALLENCHYSFVRREDPFVKQPCGVESIVKRPNSGKAAVPTESFLVVWTSAHLTACPGPNLTPIILRQLSLPRKDILLVDKFVWR
ncbi:hypothetical protein M0802_009373 [Mischocyttarus mexicanus]|nr:hypothetical protein M0802_009373 [Mischocyttarus mexicanus]